MLNTSTISVGKMLKITIAIISLVLVILNAIFEPLLPLILWIGVLFLLLISFAVLSFTEDENFKTIEFISLLNVTLVVQLSIFALLLCLIFEQFIFTRLCNVVLLEIVVGLLMYHGQSMQMKHGIAQLLNLTDSTAQTVWPGQLTIRLQGKTNNGGIQLSRSNSFVSVDISETAIGTDNGRTPVVMTISTRRLSSPVPVSSPEIQATELDVSTCSSSRSSSDLEHHHQQSENNQSRREKYSFGKAVNEFDKL